jgi:hypothetical protein
MSAKDHSHRIAIVGIDAHVANEGDDLEEKVYAPPSFCFERVFEVSVLTCGNTQTIHSRRHQNRKLYMPIPCVSPGKWQVDMTQSDRVGVSNPCACTPMS